ncbi:MAG: FtsX-like permease family protein [Alphaproteobacteria bacterium]|nr:FtsX-like permease family protein [Alphaproteobacteria bacterium]
MFSEKIKALSKIPRPNLPLVNLKGKHPLIDTAIDKLALREYDLPLHKSEDSKFLVLLVGLMSFLAVLAFTGAFTLSAMSARWSSGLENKVTVEILAETREGLLRSDAAVKEDTQKIAKILSQSPIVKTVDIMDEKEIHDLIAPWIGKDLSLTDVPLPGLIAVELRSGTKPEQLAKLTRDIEDASRSANLSTHQDWLADLVRLTGTLQLVALVIAAIIGITTITAISGGTRTRMAIHREEVELLHLIGATDRYIARQFQRHALVLALKGAVAGTLSGLLIALIVALLPGNSDSSLTPQITLGAAHYIFLLLLPLLAGILAATTARFTVLRALARMP